MQRRASSKRNSLKKDKQIDIIASELMKKINAEAEEEHTSEFLNEIEGNANQKENQVLSRAKNLVEICIDPDKHFQRKESNEERNCKDNKE